MSRRRSARTLGVLLVLCGLGVTSCGSDEAGSTARPTAAPSPTTSPDAGATSVASGAGSLDPDLLHAATDRIISADVDHQLDPDCVQQRFALLTEDQLRLVIEADTDSTDPRLTPISFQLLDCLDLGGQSSLVVGEAVPALPDPCTIVSTDLVRTVFAGLGTGERGSAVTPYGDSTTCTWSDAAGERVTVSLYASPDLDAWIAESEDGDSVSDGEPVTGVGDRAYAGYGRVSFSHGPVLAEVHCFPGFDVDPATLVAIAQVVDAQL